MMNQLNKYTKLYFDFAIQSFKVYLEYRIDLLLGIFRLLIQSFFSITFIWIIFQNIHDINGWQFYEVMFLYGIMYGSVSLFGFVFGNLWNLGNFIRSGRLDIFLVRPMTILFQQLVDYFDRDNLPGILISIIIISTSVTMLHLKIGLFGILMLTLFVISGAAIIGAIHLMVLTTGIWFVDVNNFASALLDTNQFTQYPITIYHRSIQIILTFITPYAFTSFFPANYFLHKGFEQYSLLSPVIAIVLWIIAINFWKFGIKNYSSTGS